MEKIKLAVIYYSSTGTNLQMAQWAADAAAASGAEVRRRRIKETAPDEAIAANEAWKTLVQSEAYQNEQEASLDDLLWADALLFSIPTRYGNLPSQVQSFIDTTGGLWSEGKLANKMVSAMSSAQNPHGGQETTILALYKTMIHWGCIIVPPAYTFDESFPAGGNPYGTSTTTSMEGEIKDDIKGAVIKQVQRLVEMTERFVGVHSEAPVE